MELTIYLDNKGEKLQSSPPIRSTRWLVFERGDTQKHTKKSEPQVFGMSSSIPWPQNPCNSTIQFPYSLHVLSSNSSSPTRVKMTENPEYPPKTEGPELVSHSFFDPKESEAEFVIRPTKPVAKNDFFYPPIVIKMPAKSHDRKRVVATADISTGFGSKSDTSEKEGQWRVSARNIPGDTLYFVFSELKLPSPGKHTIIFRFTESPADEQELGNEGKRYWLRSSKLQNRRPSLLWDPIALPIKTDVTVEETVERKELGMSNVTLGNSF